jgi:parallel beta-helix repeat protein
MNKKKILFSIVLSILLCSGCFELAPPSDTTKIYVDDDGKAEFTQIQEAIDIASPGGTVFVYNGTYFERLVINKSITLIGESMSETAIYFTGDTHDPVDIVLVTADDCVINNFGVINAGNSSNVTGVKIVSSGNTISNLTISRCKYGILVDGGSNNNISQNSISNSYGILLRSSDNNNISKNDIFFSIFYSLCLEQGSDNNIIFGNNITRGFQGIGIHVNDSEFNRVFGNVIMYNRAGAWCCCGALYNIFYNNVFKLNRDYNARDDGNNTWDSVGVGNYWHDYLDKYPDATEIDGVWDTPYNITGDIKDRYPLVNPPVT